MVSGSTTRSNSAALMSPNARAASRKVLPVSADLWAMALALKVGVSPSLRPRAPPSVLKLMFAPVTGLFSELCGVNQLTWP